MNGLATMQRQQKEQPLRVEGDERRDGPHLSQPQTPVGEAATGAGGSSNEAATATITLRRNGYSGKLVFKRRSHEMKPGVLKLETCQIPASTVGRDSAPCKDGEHHRLERAIFRSPWVGQSGRSAVPTRTLTELREIRTISREIPRLEQNSTVSVTGSPYC